ncbi:MAG: hypothetical protein ACR2QK_09730 [Acidimicrobiales bacterium]
MNHEEATTDIDRRRTIRRRLRGERGAVGTEMAIVVAIVVAISLALGVVMRNSAQQHQQCIPATPGAAVPAGC